MIPSVNVSDPKADGVALNQSTPVSQRVTAWAKDVAKLTNDLPPLPSYASPRGSETDDPPWFKGAQGEVDERRVH